VPVVVAYTHVVPVEMMSVPITVVPITGVVLVPEVATSRSRPGCGLSAIV
jgi:hypothetical protein